MHLAQELSPLDHMEDQDLKRLVVLWRAQALRGNREAFGIAHALEVELRRRWPEGSTVSQTPAVVSLRRSWWKFW
jgi:hypothetical protein